MRHFTIDAENNITLHASRKAAQETGTGVFSTEEQFADLIGPEPKRLIGIWNSLPGVKPVTKFENRKKATERIWRAIQHLGGEAASQEPAAPATQFDEPVATAGAQTAHVAPTQAKGTQNATRAKKAPQREPKAKADREGSNKKAEVIAMMKRASGATLPEIMAATGWQKHTVRGFVSILGSKGGEKIESSKNTAGERTYRLRK